MSGPEPSSDVPAAPAAPAAPPRKRWWRHWKLILAGIVATPVLVFVLFAYTALHWSYSAGERAGTLQKFSKKGWLCKTWEGELMQPTAPGVAPTVWNFTVRDDEIARRVNLGLGRHVVLRYEEHRGVPTTCFGDTQYYVVGFRLER